MPADAHGRRWPTSRFADGAAAPTSAATDAVVSCVGGFDLDDNRMEQLNGGECAAAAAAAAEAGVQRFVMVSVQCAATASCPPPRCSRLVSSSRACRLTILHTTASSCSDYNLPEPFLRNGYFMVGSQPGTTSCFLVAETRWKRPH